jgi:hypothetical protein
VWCLLFTGRGCDFPQSVPHLPRGSSNCVIVGLLSLGGLSFRFFSPLLPYCLQQFCALCILRVLLVLNECRVRLHLTDDHRQFETTLLTNLKPSQSNVSQ